MDSFSPKYSILNSLKNFIKGRISFPKNLIGEALTMESGDRFRIFRQIKVKSRAQNSSKTVFIIQFKLKNMSVSMNRLFSILPIPMFIGLPGFEKKLWMCNEESGINQGIYQWRSEEDAIRYSKSFAVRFMMKRSIPQSINFRIIPNMGLEEYVEALLV